MFRDVLRAEIKRLARDRVFLVTLLLLVAAALFSLGNGLVRLRDEVALVGALDREQSARFDKLARDIASGSYPRTDWSDLSKPGAVAASAGARNVVLRPRPLAVLTAGGDHVAPDAVRVSIIRDPFRSRLDAIENPYHLLVGTFDFVFAMVAIFPLFILGLTYDLVSSERERGTLTLLLTAPISFDRILIAKLLVRAVVTVAAAVLLASGAIALACAAPSEGTTSPPEDVLVGAALAIAAFVLYAAFWFFVGLAIQRLRRSSQTNALLALGAWMLVVVLVPATLDLVLSAAHPPPSRLEMLATTRDAQIVASRRKAEALAAYYEDHPGLGDAKADLADFWVAWVAQARLVDDGVSAVESRFEDRLAERREFVGRAEILSPAIVMESILTEIAGTGAERRHAFARQARAFDRRYRTFFEEMVLAKKPFTLADVGAIPDFTFDDPTRGAAFVGRAACSLAALFVAALAAAAAALWRLGQIRWLDAA